MLFRYIVIIFDLTKQNEMTVADLTFNPAAKYTLPAKLSEYRSIGYSAEYLEQWKQAAGEGTEIRIQQGLNYLEVFVPDWEKQNRELKAASDNFILNF